MGSGWDDVMGTVRCGTRHPAGFECERTRRHGGSHRAKAAGRDVEWVDGQVEPTGRCPAVYPKRAGVVCGLPDGHAGDHQGGGMLWRPKRATAGYVPVDSGLGVETVAANAVTGRGFRDGESLDAPIDRGERVALRTAPWDLLVAGSDPKLDGVREAVRERDGRVPLSVRSGEVVVVHRRSYSGVGDGKSHVRGTADEVARATWATDVVTVRHDSGHVLQWAAGLLVHWTEPPEVPEARPFETTDADWRAKRARGRS